MMRHVLLISTYELGRQPFGIASPAAWLREAGCQVVCTDLSRDELPDETIEAADVIAFYLPMHTATRLAVPLIDRARALNARARLAAFGLYARLNADLLRARGIEAIFGGEFEEDLTAWVLAARSQVPGPPPGIEGSQSGFQDRGFVLPGVQGATTPSAGVVEGPRSIVQGQGLRRVQFKVPDRSGLPPLSKYAALQMPDGSRRTTGYVEASRGCKHLCRHCPVVPVYEGRFRIVPVDIVLADVRGQVAAGARHITFGDPDFFNGIKHAVAVVTAFGREFPDVSYDVTIKIEHLLTHAGALPVLARTGCLFVTSAVESVDDQVLAKLQKGHTRADFERALRLCRDAGLTLVPTFVAFTPWLTLEGYDELLDTLEELDIVGSVPPIQLALRLLITNGSRLLELTDIRAVIGDFDPKALVYPWRHPDARVDEIQRQVEAIVGRRLTAPRAETFATIRGTVDEARGMSRQRHVPLAARAAVPYLTEPWYC